MNDLCSFSLRFPVGVKKRTAQPTGTVGQQPSDDDNKPETPNRIRIPEFGRHLRPQFSLVGLLMLVAMLGSCMQKKTGARPLQTRLESEARPAVSLNLLDPEDSSVELKPIEVRSGDFGENFKVPVFQVARADNVFIKILRCDARSDVLRNIIAKAGPDKRKWIWIDTLGSPDECKIAAMKSLSAEFQDIAAPDGKFYYIVNPCVAAENSTTGEEGCSYKLQVSNVVTYDGALSKWFREQADALRRAEESYDELISRLHSLSQRILAEKERCLDDYASAATAADRALKKKQMNAHFISLGVGAVVGIGVALLTARAMKGKKMGRKLPFLVGGTAMVGAAAIGAGIARGFSAKRPARECAKAKAFAGEMIAIRDSGDVERAIDILIERSKVLTEANRKFEGYNRQIFEGTL